MQNIKNNDAVTSNYNFLKNNNLKIINLTTSNLVLTAHQDEITAFIVPRHKLTLNNLDFGDFAANVDGNSYVNKNHFTYLIYDESKSKDLDTTSPLYYGMLINFKQLAKKEINFDNFKLINFVKHIKNNTISVPHKDDSYFYEINSFETDLILNLSIKYNNHIYYLNNLLKDNIFLGLNNSSIFDEESFKQWFLNCKNTAFVIKKDEKEANFYNDALDNINKLQWWSQTWASNELISFGDLSWQFYNYIKDIEVFKNHQIVCDFAVGLIYAVFKDIVSKNPNNFKTEAEKRLLVSNLANNLKQRLNDKNIVKK